MTKKDPKDLLREIKSQIEGVDSKDISFNDLRKKKIKKSKKVKKSDESESYSSIISNKEGFSLSGVETKYCDYRDIKGKRKLTKKNSLDEWGPFDFFNFANKLYVEKYKKEWDLNIGGNSLEINRIRDKFYDAFGFCCNLIMRDYIVYFFENRIDDFIAKKGCFYFSHMRSDWVIKEFVENYNFRERFAAYTVNRKSRSKKIEITKEAINNSFAMGDTTLITNYGVVIALNFLLKVKRMPKKDAISTIVNACKDMASKDLIDVIKKSTEAYSPYPSKLIFKSPQLIFNKISDDISISVEFNDNKSMPFLHN
jgi:hypothetical protein